MGNAPIVGDLASVTWHLNMMGHGAMWNGGDRDIAVLRISEDTNEGAEGTAWNIKGKNEPCYRFPEYVNQLPESDAYTDALDRADGAADGKWRSELDRAAGERVGHAGARALPGPASTPR